MKRKSLDPTSITTGTIREDKSIVDDFPEMGYCKRESKLALRSAEIKPSIFRFVLTKFFVFFTLRTSSTKSIFLIYFVTLFT